MTKSAKEILLENLQTFTPEVKGAVQSLLTQFDDLQENFYQAVAIIDEITAPKNPRVEIIDEKHRRFNGDIFVKHSNGYYVLNKTLHNAVYQFYNGLEKIPEGYVVHHNGKDENGNYSKEKNDIEDLILMKRGEHTKLHGKTELNQIKTFICRVCGKSFQANNHGTNCICSPKCERQAHPARKKRIYKEERICKWCGKKFLADKHRSKGYCSIRCGSLAQWDRYRKNKK